MPSKERCEFGLSQEPLNTGWLYELKHDDFKNATNGKQVLQNVCMRIYEPSAEEAQVVKTKWQQLAAANQDLTFVNVHGICMPTLLWAGKTPSQMPGALMPSRGLSLPAAFPVNEKVMQPIGMGDEPSRGPLQRIDPLYNRITVNQGGEVVAKKELSILPVLGVATLGALGIWWMMGRK